jgi:outer membrane protein assembly factor BamE (lipoprotein component of BamABCDE complex)
MRTSIRDRRALAAACAVTLGLCLPSCVISSSSRTEYSGNYVSDQTLQQVKVGAKPDYVLAVLGEPSTKSRLEDGTEIWKWRYTQSRSSSSSIIFAFSGNSKTDTVRNTYVQFEDGKVVKSWRD